MHLVPLEEKRTKEEYLEILELRYVQDFSCPEIALKLGIPLGTVKSQLHRATRKLQEIVKEH